jgi:hypothetical protein
MLELQRQRNANEEAAKGIEDEKIDIAVRQNRLDMFAASLNNRDLAHEAQQHAFDQEWMRIREQQMHNNADFDRLNEHLPITTNTNTPAFRFGQCSAAVATSTPDTQMPTLP